MNETLPTPAPLRTRVFIDFWNIQIEWNDTVGKRTGINWFDLPRVFAIESQRELRSRTKIEQDDTLSVVGSHLVGSVGQSQKDQKLEQFLTGKLGTRPDWDVLLMRRDYQDAECSWCHIAGQTCRGCGRLLTKKVEKGADVQLVTMFMEKSLSTPRELDCVILVSMDEDFVPAVKSVMDRGVVVVNATWKNRGFHLRNVCDAHIDINGLVRYLALAV